MGLADFGITVGRDSYTALRYIYPHGIKWIRGCIGSSVDIENGIPSVIQKKTKLDPYEVPTITVYHRKVADALIKDRIASLPLGARREHFVDLEDGLCPITSEGEGITYSVWITTLLQPWGDMLTHPYHNLNREISRFAGKYDSPGYNPLTEYEKLLQYLIKKVKEIAEAREEKIKQEMKKEKGDENKPSCEEAGLGIKIDDSEAARKAREAKMKEQRRIRENLKIEEHLPAIILGQVLENADPGYLLLILSSNDIGLTHPNDSVREGTMNLMPALIKAILFNLEEDISSKSLTLGETLQEKRVKSIDEAISLLQCVSRVLNVKHYGVNDTNKSIQRKAKELEDFVIDAGIRFKTLKNEFNQSGLN